MADSTGLSWYQDPSALALASLGLGAIGTGMGAYSAMNTAEQQNQLRNMAINSAQGMANPATVTGQASQYFNAGLPQVNAAAQNLLQQQIAPIEGMRGYDPRSGQGQLIYSQAVAPLYYQAWQDAVNAAQRGQANALGGITTATPNINVPTGSTNALSSSLQGLMLMTALQNMGRPAAAAAAPAIASALPLGASDAGVSMLTGEAPQITSTYIPSAENLLSVPSSWSDILPSFSGGFGGLDLGLGF